MRASVHHRTTCRLCDSARLETVVPMAPIPLAEKYVSTEQRHQVDELYPVDLSMCLDCGHVQLLDVVDPDVLWKDYTYYSGQTRGLVEHFERFVERAVQDYELTRPGLAVDIGSNDGSLLQLWKNRGWKVQGIDPAQSVADLATSHGIPTEPALFSPELAARLRERLGPAQIVTAFNSFAHSDDLAAMAKGIRDLLAPNGLFAFEAQYLLDVVQKTLLGTIFHEHLSHHSVAPLIPFLERHGLELIHVRRANVQNGSIIGFGQLLHGPRQRSQSIDELLTLERDARLADPGTLRAMADRIRHLRDQMQGLVQQWKQEGRSVAAYGAARSGPTFINNLGLDGVIDYILDDHPQKVGKFSPGNHIEVVPTLELSRRAPDVVIILAWVHAERIVAQNQSYLEQGGQFVLCFPEISVISGTTRASVNQER